MTKMKDFKQRLYYLAYQLLLTPPETRWQFRPTWGVPSGPDLQ